MVKAPGARFHNINEVDGMRTFPVVHTMQNVINAVIDIELLLVVSRHRLR
jgi:hypothetical protein